MSGAEKPLSLARPTANGIVVRAVGMALGLAVAVFLARNLAAEDLGAYQGVLSVCVILGSLASATAERPAARRIAALDGKDPTELPSEIAMAHLVAGIAMLAIALPLVAGSLFPAVPEAAVVTLRLAALVAPGLAILSLRQWIALPLQGVAASLGPEQIGQPLLFLGLAGYVAYHAELGPFQALAIYALVCWLVWLVSSWRSGLLSLFWTGIREPSTGPSLRPRLREGRPFVLLAIVGVLPGYTTVPLVAALLGLADAGRLAIALQFTGLVAVPLQIVSLAIMPQCARLHRDADTEALDTLVRTASGISLALGSALAALLLLLLDTILGVLGPSFAATSRLIPILVIGQLVNAGLGPNGPTLQMIGLERELAWVETGTTVLRFVAVALAASVGSILGVALALAATTTLRNVLLSLTLHRKSGILTLPQLRRRHAH
jgi:O-antigen/teichoic acid export membrane protein